jgi:hypothetical protein
MRVDFDPADRIDFKPQGGTPCPEDPFVGEQVGHCESRGHDEPPQHFGTVEIERRLRLARHVRALHHDPCARRMPLGAQSQPQPQRIDDLADPGKTIVLHIGILNGARTVRARAHGKMGD